MKCPVCENRYSDNMEACPICGWEDYEALDVVSKENRIREIEQARKKFLQDRTVLNVPDHRENDITLSVDSEKKNDNTESGKKTKKLNPVYMAAIGIIGIAAVIAILISTHVICISHRYSEATCTEPSACIYCGHISRSALGHEWDSVEFPSSHICLKCGSSIIPASVSHIDVMHIYWGDNIEEVPESPKVVSLSDLKSIGVQWNPPRADFDTFSVEMIYRTEEEIPEAPDYMGYIWPYKDISYYPDFQVRWDNGYACVSATDTAREGVYELRFYKDLDNSEELHLNITFCYGVSDQLYSYHSTRYDETYSCR